MYSSLDRVDIVGETDAGAKLYLQTDHRDPQEIADEIDISILFALTRVLNAVSMAQKEGGDYEVRYVLPSDAPPKPLQQAVAAAGGTMEAAMGALPIDGGGADPYGIADAAMARLAETVARREGFELDEAGLRGFEQEVFARNPDAEEDEISYWTLRMELAAVAGELLRTGTGGGWTRDEHNMSLFPFAFGAEGGQTFNVFGRVERLFDEGVGEGPIRLVAMAADHEVESGGVMFSIKPGAFGAGQDVVCRPLIDLPESSEIDADIPVVVYGEDRPNTFAHFMRDEERDQSIDDFHEQALAFSRTVDVDIHEVDIAGLPLFVVTGAYYAAEKILDPEFMTRMHDKLGAELILASIPRKGVLFLTNAISEEVPKFLQVTEMKFGEQEAGEPISTTPFLVQEGRVVGLATASRDIPEQKREKKGFFSKLFRKH